MYPDIMRSMLHMAISGCSNVT